MRRSASRSRSSGAATCAIAYLAGIELTGQRVIAALAGILCAFYPPLIWHSVHLMTEPLFIFLSVLCLYAAFLFRRTGRLRWAVAGGPGRAGWRR